MMPVKKSQNWLPGIFNDFFGNEWIEKANSASPAINIIESDTDYKVELAAPGMTKDDFSVKIDADNQLVVSMEKKEEHKDEDKKGRYLPFLSSSLCSSFFSIETTNWLSASIFTEKSSLVIPGAASSTL